MPEHGNVTSTVAPTSAPESADAESGDAESGDGHMTAREPAPKGRQTPFVIGVSAYSDWVELRRLKVLAVVLPIVFVVALEFVLATIVGKGLLSDGYRLIFVLITVLSIAAFGLVMFRFIDHTQRQVVRANRELEATNAVSTAMRGQVGVDRIIEMTLASVLASSGAAEVSVTVFAPDGTHSNTDSVTYHRRAESASGSSGPPEVRNAGARLVEIPLATATKLVGRMLLYLPAEAKEADGLGPDTLVKIGLQLAAALERAQLVADLERRNHEGHIFHNVLLQISNQSPPAEILESVVRHARDLLGSQDAAVCLSQVGSRSVWLEGTASCGDGTACITTEPCPVQKGCDSQSLCPIRSPSLLTTSLAVPLPGPTGTLGDLWIARRRDVPFSGRDRDFLDALCGLASIALTSAQARENERQAAILAERERIAREMHDSLAQVLGVTHLRLRALDYRPAVSSQPDIALELAELADICEEAYSDVREAILGLRESSRKGRGLLESLRAYLAKYTRQCGIETSCVSDLDHDLALSPRSEVQLIRVIQEALTNVRKHSGAMSATIRITESESTTTLVVEDDGHGFDLAGSHLDRDGFGLCTMRERMELLNGTLAIDSAPGHGTRVIAVVPERSHPKPVPVEVKSADTQSSPRPARGRSAALPWRNRGPDRRAG